MARVENPMTMDEKNNADLCGDESKRRLVLEPVSGLGTSQNHRDRKNSAQAWHSLPKLTIISGLKSRPGIHGYVGRSSANGGSADTHVGGSRLAGARRVFRRAAR